MQRLARIGCVVLLGAMTAYSQPQSAPHDRLSPENRQRIADFLSVIDGQNTMPARRLAARELLRQGWAETPRRLAAVLASPNRSARIAVALTLAESREYLDDEYVEPLIALLRDDESEARQAASAALAAFGSSKVIERLKTMLSDFNTPQPAKLAAIDTLGQMTHREAIGALIDAIADSSSPLCAAALASLERASAQDFNGNVTLAAKWWIETKHAPLPAWQQIQIDRLVRQNDTLRNRNRELETRLKTALRESFQRAGESDRASLISSFLADSSDVARMLAIELVQASLAEGKSLSPEVAARIRTLTAAAEPRVRAVAIRTLASLRDSQDAERFEQLFASETDPDVRVALVYGLGYVGSARVVPLILGLASSPSESQGEAVAALGRLGERGMIEGAQLDAMLTTCATLFADTRSAAATLRERLARTMGKMGDRRFAALLTPALASTEPPGVRVTSIRALAALLDASNGADAPASSTISPTTAPASRGALIDQIAALAADADAGVRKAVVEALVGLCETEAHLLTLWNRAQPAQESDEAIRAVAWRGVLQVLAKRPTADVDAWIDRIAEPPPGKLQRTLDLLLVVEKSLAADSTRRNELGRTRARIAAQRGLLGQVAEAVAAYSHAIEDLSASQSPATGDVAVEFLLFALQNDRYDAPTAALLSMEKTGLSPQRAWEAVRAEVEHRLKPETADRAIAMLSALLAAPPSPLTPELHHQIEEMLQRARALRTEAGADRATSGPNPNGRKS